MNFSHRLAGLALVFSTIACALTSGAPTLESGGLATFVAATLAAQPSQPSEASATTGPFPTETTPPDQPTVVHDQSAARVQFGPGKTNTTIHGQIVGANSVLYVLGAAQGQQMTANLNPGSNLVLEVRADDGAVLAPAAGGHAAWQGELPATQDYYIEIIPTGNTASYSLYVSIPVDVQFAPGATSISYQGGLDAGQTVEYLAYAFAGQSAEVTVTSPGNHASLHITGMVDGVEYVGTLSGNTTWNASLSKTQDYLIQVVSDRGTASYTLTISFTN